MAGGLSILGLTDTAAALSCAGLSRGDISHDRILESELEVDLQLDLVRIVPTYETIQAEGEDPTATMQQQVRLLALKNYAKWFCAVLLCKRWLSIVQLKSDGKTRMDRFDRMDLTQMQANAESEKAKALSQLYSLLPAGSTPTRRVPTLFGLSVPDTDPVTDIEA